MPDLTQGPEWRHRSPSGSPSARRPIAGRCRTGSPMRSPLGVIGLVSSRPSLPRRCTTSTRALALRAADADADLRDLRVRRARRPAARGPGFGRRRAAPRPARLARARALHRPLHPRVVDGLALRRPRDPGTRDRRGHQCRQRGAPRPPPAPRCGCGRSGQRRRERGGPRARIPRLVVARAARSRAPRRFRTSSSSRSSCSRSPAPTHA